VQIDFPRDSRDHENDAQQQDEEPEHAPLSRIVDFCRENSRLNIARKLGIDFDFFNVYLPFGQLVAWHRYLDECRGSSEAQSVVPVQTRKRPSMHE
jgi:hypothetical protein